jgi:hypothetical protein
MRVIKRADAFALHYVRKCAVRTAESLPCVIAGLCLSCAVLPIVFDMPALRAGSGMWPAHSLQTVQARTCGRSTPLSPASAAPYGIWRGILSAGAVRLAMPLKPFFGLADIQKRFVTRGAVPNGRNT